MSSAEMLTAPTTMDEKEKLEEDLKDLKGKCLGVMVGSVVAILCETIACTLMWMENAKFLFCLFGAVGLFCFYRGVRITYIYFDAVEMEKELKSTAP